MIVIFDLDGTLANIDHRKHFVESKNPQWLKCYQACVNDTPNEVVIKMFNLLRDDGNTMVIFSGRGEEVRKETYQWLRKHGVKPDILLMRPEGDHTSDNDLKRKWLKIINKKDILCVFDDRNKVVKMWRDEGLTCFQVAEGNF